MSTSASEKENLLSISPPSGFFLGLSITQSLFNPHMHKLGPREPTHYIFGD